jgi:protein involved in polysaccharide export with SLBB domain
MPGDFGVEAGVTHIKDIISKAGGMLYYSADTAELTRVKVTQAGPVTERILLNVDKAMKGDPKNNIPLEINDYIFIRTVPEWDLYKVVELQGEVKYPGKYSIRRGERLSSLIDRAGGYTDKAYLPGSFFTRVRVRDLQQQGIDEMVSRLERELLTESSMQIAGAATAADVQGQKAALEAKQKFIQTLRKQKATGRMSIRLADIAHLKASEFDIEMEEGDYLNIPTMNSVVNVTGAVMSPGSYIYSKSFDYKDYIEMSGGFSQYADSGNTYVVKADGSARKLAKGFFSWSNSRAKWEYGGESGGMDPGDTIVAPENFDRIAWLREIKDITQIMMQIAVAAGVVLAVH